MWVRPPSPAPGKGLEPSRAPGLFLCPKFAPAPQAIETGRLTQARAWSHSRSGPFPLPKICARGPNKGNHLTPRKELGAVALSSLLNFPAPWPMRAGGAGPPHPPKPWRGLWGLPPKAPFPRPGKQQSLRLAGGFGYGFGWGKRAAARLAPP